MKVLITGSAGFIGSSLAFRLLADGYDVVGIDNVNSYYDPGLKRKRIERLQQSPRFSFIEGDIADRESWKRISESHPDVAATVHLAAQAGVRYSATHPREYAHSNLIGFLEVLEYVRETKQAHLVYASSSSVYGNDAPVPNSTKDPTSVPMSFYAATKMANELMAISYARMHNVHSTGVRFFSVYGPWGRPDMAYYSFADNILGQKPITVYDDGEVFRDFTYIDDVVEGLKALLHRPDFDQHPHRVYNLGNGQPVRVKDMVSIIERLLGVKAVVRHQALPKTDAFITKADTEPMQSEFGWQAKVSIEEGLEKFVEWYLKFRKPE